jgi:F-type H+-transporting ATPase subunit b
LEYQAFHAVPWAHGSFWVFIAIVLFAVLAGRQIAAALTALLDARTQSVRNALDEAAQLKAEAEALLAQAKAAQVQAEEDAKSILETAQATAARLTAELEEAANAAAKWRERMAMERIAAAEGAAVKDVRSAAIDIASAACAALLQESFGAQADAAMLDKAIAEVPSALRQSI